MSWVGQREWEGYRGDAGENKGDCEGEKEVKMWKVIGGLP